MTKPFEQLRSLQQGLRELGYVEGKNLTFEYRFAEGGDDRYPALAAELAGLGVDVIVTWGSPAALAAKRATATIPIVMASIGDPIGTGVVSNLAHPGGNITGLTSLNSELENKRLELLKELVPQLSRLGVLANATNPYSAETVQRARQAAEAMGLTLEPAWVEDQNDIESELGKLAQARPDAVLMIADTLLYASHKRIVEFTLERRLPAIFPFREYAEDGGLMVYAPDYRDLFRRAAGYIDKILKGANPGELPIQQAGKFELVINLRTARTLGIEVPPSLLTRADEVIE